MVGLVCPALLGSLEKQARKALKVPLVGLDLTEDRVPQALTVAKEYLE
jgi:hypothetical protein